MLEVDFAPELLKDPGGAGRPRVAVVAPWSLVSVAADYRILGRHEKWFEPGRKRTVMLATASARRALEDVSRLDVDDDRALERFVSAWGLLSSPAARGRQKVEPTRELLRELQRLTRWIGVMSRTGSWSWSSPGLPTDLADVWRNSRDEAAVRAPSAKEQREFAREQWARSMAPLLREVSVSISVELEAQPQRGGERRFQQTLRPARVYDVLVLELAQWTWGREAIGVCEQCHGIFTGRRNDARYCSDEHRIAALLAKRRAQRRQVQADRALGFRGRRCVQCGAPLAHSRRAGKRRFCDNQDRCKNAYHAKRRLGRGHRVATR